MRRILIFLALGFALTFYAATLQEKVYQERIAWDWRTCHIPPDADAFWWKREFSYAFICFLCLAVPCFGMSEAICLIAFAPFYVTTDDSIRE